MIMKTIRKFILYPLCEGGIATIIIPAFVFALSAYLSRIGGILFGPSGVIPGLILEVAVVGYCFGFLHQIVLFSSEGKDYPPYWEIKRMDIEEWAKGLFPIAISLIESFSSMFIIIVLFSIINSTPILYCFRIFWKTVGFTLFSIFYPINLLSWSIREDFNIFHLLWLLSHKGIIYLLTLFSVSLLILIFLIFCFKWNNFFLIFVEYAIVFYLLQIYSYGLGRLYYIYSD